MKGLALTLLLAASEKSLIAAQGDFDPGSSFNPTEDKPDSREGDTGDAETDLANQQGTISTTNDAPTATENRFIGITVDPNFPKYYTQKMSMIRQGTTEHNIKGWYLDGDYSSVLDQFGDVTLEVNMTLHHPKGVKHVNDGVYLFWIQAPDPAKYDENLGEYYESFTCAIRYSETYSPEIHPIYLYRMGYIGRDKLQYLNNVQFQKLMENDQIEEYPWLLHDERTGKSRFNIDETNGLYSETCSMYREFITTYSNISLKAKGVYRLNGGYKVYNFWEDTTTEIFGHKLGIEWAIAEVGSGALLRIGSSIAVLATALIS